MSTLAHQASLSRTYYPAKGHRLWELVVRIGAFAPVRLQDFAWIHDVMGIQSRFYARHQSKLCIASIVP